MVDRVDPLHEIEKLSFRSRPVTLLTLDTMGLMPIGFLWIFFRKYSWEVLYPLGGMQKSFISLSIMPVL